MATPAPNRWMTPLVVVVFLLLASLARADGPEVSCSALAVGGRVLVDPLLERLFDDEMLRLVRLGLEGRVHLDVQLKRRRSFWRDERLDTQSLDFTVRWSAAAQRFLLDGRREIDPARITTERLVLHPGEAREGLKVELSARLQVVTAKSLGSVAGWMVESDRPAAMPALLNVLANDLVRSSSGSCEPKR